MIIIFWKSFPYFPSALQSCGLFVVPDGWWPQSELVNWLNWAQLGWVLLSSSFPTEWALCVPWASDLKNEHCMNPLGANNSSSGTSGAMSPLPCRVRALHKYRIQNIWEFSPGKHPLCWAVNSSLSAWALCSQVNTVRGCFISHREISLQQNPVQSSRRWLLQGRRALLPGAAATSITKGAWGGKTQWREFVQHFRADQNCTVTILLWWLFCVSGVASLWSFVGVIMEREFGR